MAKQKLTKEDDQLLAQLGVEADKKRKSKRTPREERIISGFEDIKEFFETNNRLPIHGENKDIFERLYAVRLDKIKNSKECRDILSEFDTLNILGQDSSFDNHNDEDLDDSLLLEALGVSNTKDNDITKLTHVKTRSEKKAAEEIAQRTPCSDFKIFKPLFEKIKNEIKTSIRKTIRFQKSASIKEGEFFILYGQVAYVAEVGEEFRTPNGDIDARLRVVYDNATESNLLLRSLQRALYKDEAGRRITTPSAGPLFSEESDETDIQSGTIYVLRSKSNDPYIKENYEVIHKIGVTGGDVKKRFLNVKNDPTFLMADIEIVTTYKLANINRKKLESLVHRFFEPAKLDIEIRDRFGKPIKPREWFLVPLFIIDKVVEKIKNKTIADYRYDPQKSELVRI